MTQPESQTQAHILGPVVAGYAIALPVPDVSAKARPAERGKPTLNELNDAWRTQPITIGRRPSHGNPA
ncbi:hypothetical protein [Salinisphaera sp. S4-8]|uniref:hypothetical protein n=1 Tax=Salinisphaera sp. S4-8 TaxID=633357 RepID=UPI00334061BE